MPLRFREGRVAHISHPGAGLVQRDYGKRRTLRQLGSLGTGRRNRVIVGDNQFDHSRIDPSLGPGRAGRRLQVAGPSLGSE